MVIGLYLTTSSDARCDDRVPELPSIALSVTESWPIDHATHHVQGLAATGDSFWISSVDRAARKGYLYRVERATGKVAVERDLTREAQIHSGGMQLVGDELWVALAEYRPKSKGTVLRLDAETLEERGAFLVDDHLGAVATDGRERVYAVNWDSRTIYTFDLSGKLLATAPNETGIAWQDIEWHDGQLWGIGQTKVEGVPRGVVDVIDIATWKPVRRYLLEGHLKSPRTTFGREGFTFFEKSILALPEDGPHSTVYRFPLPVAQGHTAD
ncbi:MAG: hypothetical protein KF708_16425 [Pirellulales bacterium]|nr:hypothetical protein [Pirellulales bacterium]